MATIPPIHDEADSEQEQRAAIFERNLLWIRRTILTLVGVGLVSLVILVSSSLSLRQSLQLLGRGSAVASAAFAVGGILGFLFGIPRAPSGKPDGTFQHNTNLEQISDWLTKALVGAGLTQLQPIWGGVRSGARMVAEGSGGVLGEASAISIMILYGVAGFLAGYLFTALFLGQALMFAITAGTIAPTARRALEQFVPHLSDSPATAPSPEATAAGVEVRKIGLDQLNKVEDLVMWARAQMAARAYDRAADAYDRALRLRPDDPKLRREYAVALASAKANSAAILQLQRARERSGEETSRETRENILLDLMFNHLYVGQPAGFTQALALADQYEKEGGDLRNPRLWVYKAAALGQQFAWEKERQERDSTPDPARLQRIRAEALEAVKKALEYDGLAWKQTLRGLLEATDPEENDLVAFRDDPDFRQLLT